MLAVIDKLPHCRKFLMSLYQCEYKQFFEALVDICDALRYDRYLQAHARFICRELRIKAYAQKLRSYRSVQLPAMAKEFGVSVPFLDEELARFIAIGRLPCTIDKVDQVATMTRENTKILQYQQTIKHGDALLNRIQKLSRVVNM